jgi:hypothetical protein
MFNGGSQFWEWFVNQVAQKSSVHARVIEDIQTLCKTSQTHNISLCNMCTLPTNMRECNGCFVTYCGRDYFCKSDKKGVFSCEINCSDCDNCHGKCCICGVISCLICTDHDIQIFMCSNITCENHCYCEIHKEEALKLCK